MPTTLIPCRRCRGSGHRKLSKSSQSALDAIVKLKNPNLPELKAELPGNILSCTLNKRIIRLLSLKLIRAEGKNRYRRYLAVL